MTGSASASLSPSSTAVLVAGSALLAVAGFGYSYLTTTSSSSSSAKSGGIADIDEVEEEIPIDPEHAITADEIIKIFDGLFLELQNALAALMQQIQQVQMDGGQAIPDKQVKYIIREQLVRVLDFKQYQIIEEQFDMDLSCCEEATWEFMNDAKHPGVIRSVERLQRFWENATDEPVTGWRPGQVPGSASSSKSAEPPLSPENLINAAEAYFDALTECMRSLVHQYKAEGKDLQDPNVQQELNLDFSNNVQDAGEEGLSAINVTMNQFEMSVKLHASNPAVGRALGLLQMKQQQEMMSMGH